MTTDPAFGDFISVTSKAITSIINYLYCFNITIKFQRMSAKNIAWDNFVSSLSLPIKHVFTYNESIENLGYV